MRTEQRDEHAEHENGDDDDEPPQHLTVETLEHGAPGGVYHRRTRGSSIPLMTSAPKLTTTTATPKTRTIPCTIV